MERLLCIVGSMNAGGAETFLMKMYRALDRTKYQMDFAVAINEEGFYDKEITSLGGKIYHIVPKSQGILNNFKSIKNIVKHNKYKYVLRTSQHSLSALELLAAKMGGAKVRIFRSSNSNTVSGSRKQMLLHKLCLFMPRCFANKRIAPSTEAAEFMFGRGCIQSQKAYLLHNAVDYDIYAFNSANRNMIRNEIGAVEGHIIGHVGRFSKQKNHEFLIEVIKRVCEQREDIKFVFVGVGELQEKIAQKCREMKISEKVIFMGQRNDVPQILSAFDSFVLPSVYEGMPNVVIEAQANGMPCIVSDRVTKEANITGLVTYLPIDNVESWSDTILNCCTKGRTDTRSFFDTQGYSIESAVSTFVNIVFKR